MAEKACHVAASTAQVGLIHALGAMIKVFSLLILLGTIIFAVPHASALSIGLTSVTFQPGMPNNCGDTLLESLGLGTSSIGTPLDQSAVIADNIALIKRFPEIRFTISAYVNPAECHESECAQLGERRAKFIEDFYLSHGVQPINIVSVTWDGKDNKQLSHPAEVEFRAHRFVVFELAM